jgi:putative MATE family efflux protein
MMKSAQVDLTEGNVNRHLITLSFPLLLGVISAILVNTADTYFIAKLGIQELAAIGYAFPIAMVGVGFAFGLGSSAASLIGRTLGSNNPDTAKRQATYILISSTLFVIAISLLGILFIDNIISLLGTSSASAPLVKEYIIPWFIGLIFLVTPMVGTAILRGYGSTSVQSIVMISAAAINAILDPIFIFGLGSWDGWGLAGASWASVVARAITFFITLYFLFKPRRILSFQSLTLDEFMTTSAALFRLGIPASLVNVIAPISVGIITRVLSEFGDTAVAAFNIVARIDSLLLIPAMALTMGAGPFVSQNAGAGKNNRLHSAWRTMGFFSILWSLFIFVIVVLFGSNLIAIFAPSEEVSSFAKPLLFALAASSIGTILVPIFSSFQTAKGDASPSLIMTTVRYGVLLIPGMYIGVEYLGVNGVIAAIFLSQLISAMIAWVWGRNVFSHRLENGIAM